MTTELEFSVQLPDASLIQPLLDQFEARHRIHVNLRLLSWDTAWKDLVKVALYGDGPDVSEVGSTWLSDLIAMNALHIFAPDEIHAIGKAEDFLPAAWHSCQLAGSPEVYAIPWLVGARLIVYHRALLRQAGVDEASAFATAGNCAQTLRALQGHGVAAAWSVPTGRTHTTLLNAASWVWAAGGDFLSADGKHTLIAQPEALMGLRNYFALGQFIGEPVRQLNALEPESWFLHHADTGAIISGPWLFNQLTAAQRAEIGLALPPGPPLLGGSHLVLWKHNRKQDAALKLIRFLTQPENQINYAQRVGLLPANVEALHDQTFEADPLWSAAAEAVQVGRAAPVQRAWAMMEDRLATEFAAVWADFFANPEGDLVTLLQQRFEPLARRLDQLLAQR